jgi:predicted peptidase
MNLKISLHMRKINSLLLFLLCWIFLSASGHSQSSSKFSSNRYVENGDTLFYRMLYPDADTFRRYPLVIFLHGAGERGHDNEAQLKWGVSNFATDQNMLLHPAIVVAPQCPEKSSWSNFLRTDMNLQPDPSKPMQMLIDLIHSLVKTMPIDSNRIYITGLSMGGYGTYDAIERYPNLFAAAIPVCGAGDTSRAKSIARIPLWIVHGEDDPAVNPRYSIDMLEALRRAGARPGLTLYPGVGHFSWLGAYSDPQLLEWLFEQHK